MEKSDSQNQGSRGAQETGRVRAQFISKRSPEASLPPMGWLNPTPCFLRKSLNWDRKVKLSTQP